MHVPKAGADQSKLTSPSKLSTHRIAGPGAEPNTTVIMGQNPTAELPKSRNQPHTPPKTRSKNLRRDLALPAATISSGV